jgi:hypothetical protein
MSTVPSMGGLDSFCLLSAAAKQNFTILPGSLANI